MESAIDVFPVESEVLSASAFLKLVTENPSLIKSSTIVPPTPGKPGFGKFRVVYSRPRYRSTPFTKRARVLK